MEADDLLCSRNARPQKALVGREQWDQHGCYSTREKQASLEGSIRSMTVVRCAQRRLAWRLLVISATLQPQIECL
jgi:hypothetical protein